VERQTPWRHGGSSLLWHKSLGSVAVQTRRHCGATGPSVPGASAALVHSPAVPGLGGGSQPILKGGGFPGIPSPVSAWKESTEN